MTTPSAVANAYANLARLGDAAALTKGPGETSTGPSFGTLLKDTVASLSKTSRNADTQAVAMANGKANIIDVVTAVAESEVAIVGHNEGSHPDALIELQDFLSNDNGGNGV